MIQRTMSQQKSPEKTTKKFDQDRFCVGRGAALTQVQVNLHLHLSYWDNIVQRGDWTYIDGRSSVAVPKCFSQIFLSI